MTRKKKTRREKVKEHLAQLEKEKNKSRSNYFAYGISILLLILVFSFFDIERRTIIEFSSLFKFSSILTLITLLFLGTRLSEFLEDLSGLFWVGIVICFFYSIVFVHLNNLTFNSKYEFKTLKILDTQKTNRGKRGPVVPTVCIKYLDEEKWLLFFEDEFQRVATSEEVIIEVKKGLFGYGVIKQFDVNEGERRWRKR